MDHPRRAAASDPNASSLVPILPLYGHDRLRARLRAAVARGALPSSLLLHGPRGIGKQRLALWLGQMLVCRGPGERPCEECSSCRYARALAHPDIRWFFPRPRLESDATADDVISDLTDAMVERERAAGVYGPPSGLDGIFVGAVHAIVRLAALAPALGDRKVFVVGDAERMVPQEGAETAANAFLKLLEEPPADTTLILTSSTPGALLPTIRSRVVAVRVSALAEPAVRALLADEAVRAKVGSRAAEHADDLVRLAGGAPGRLFGQAAEPDPASTARGLLEAAGGGRDARAAAALALGGSGARGFLLDVLDALDALIIERQRSSVARGDVNAAVEAHRAVLAVEDARARAGGNVNPQLIGAELLRQLGEQLP